MSRRQAICYLVILSVPALALLVCLAIYQPLVMLAFLFLMVLGLGVLKKFRPQFFAVLRKPAKQSVSMPGPERTPAKPAYTPNLILVAGNLSSVDQILIDRPLFTLGRDPACNFSVPDAADISRFHASIRYDEKTAASYITDTNSNNGTYVNGDRLTPEKPRRLRNGDYIQLGTLRFTAQVAHY